MAARQESLAAHAERAEELTALSAEIAHELKNPLASVKGLAGLLAQQGPRREGRRAARRAAPRGGPDAGHLDEFLNFSRPLVPLALGRHRRRGPLPRGGRAPRGDGAGSAASRSRSAAEPVPARCDPRKVKQILINLVQNALEAAPAGGRAAEVEVGAERLPAGGARVLRARPRPRPRPGPRRGALLARRDHEGHGSGLGLPIARALARQHGGDLSIAPRDGGGTVAELTLPGRRAGPGGRTGRMSAPSTRVLVVDDDPGVRYTLREILEAEGLAVDEAASGEEALARYEAAPAALVLTDLRMPGMDGLALLRALVARAPAPRVVLLTAHGSERQAVEAMKAGAHDYFRKPFDVEELLAVVRRALEAVRLAHENERLAGRADPLAHAWCSPRSRCAGSRCWSRGSRRAT